MPVDHKFQVNLQGIIDLLSNHLYSGPQVYIRELLQNAVDAIQARRGLADPPPGEIQFERIAGTHASPPTLVISDNGIGLTADEVHQFLATIGESSKRDGLQQRRQDFIGQFGIGLLSCFLVSDTIVLVTRSARELDAPAVQWTGRPDGTYTLETLSREVSPGTRVFLQARGGFEDYFSTERIGYLLRHYGRYLPTAIVWHAGDDEPPMPINETPPWERRFDNEEHARAELLAWGRMRFRTDFFDAVRLKSQAGGIRGVAFVLPYSPNPASRGRHQVYLKNILLSEQSDDLLPDWAFFVRCVLNADDLRPTASREAFHDDEQLDEARESLALALRGYLVRLSEHDPERLQKLIAIHREAIKLLALHDDEFYEIMIDWLPIETSLGRMTLGEVRTHSDQLLYAFPLEQFRQIASVAASQNLLVLNAGYDRDIDLLTKMPSVFPEMSVAHVDAARLVQEFDELSEKEADRAAEFRRIADEVLSPYDCTAEVKRFRPVELPALFGTDQFIRYRRKLEQTQEVADPLWSSMLQGIAQAGAQQPARLCFNYNNPLVRKLITVREPELLHRSIELLYVQALLLGQHPLSSQELQLLGDGLLGMIRFAIDPHSQSE